MTAGKNNTRKRIVGLDIFRILAALVVFLFHSAMHIGCDYGNLRHFVRMGAIFMTGFYLLSGYVLYFIYNSKDLQQLTEIGRFLKKRILGILPLYYVCGFLYEFIFKTLSLQDNLLIFPIELLGIQSLFTSISNLSHNGGTWFVSCLLICYLLYPFIQEMVKQMANKHKMAIICFLGGILLYAPIIQIKFNTATIYDNPIFRCLEFSIGVFLASIMQSVAFKEKIKCLFSIRTVVIELFVLILGVSYGVLYNIQVDNYMFYNWIALPIFVLMIISLSGIEFKNYKWVRYLSDISYAFFLHNFLHGLVQEP